MARKKNIYKELFVESIGFEGISIARDDGMVYFVKGGVPGDKVNAKILKKKKKYTEANIQEIIEPSKDRIEPICDYFDHCGGCTWQNISYKDQLEWKRKHVEDAIKRIAKIEDFKLHDTFPSKYEFNYRNKMDFTFGASRWLTPEEINSDEKIEDKSFALGLHVRGRNDKILDIKKCHIQQNEVNEMMNDIRDLALKRDISAYHVYDKIGFLRNFVVRYSLFQDSFLIIFVTNAVENENELKFIQECSEFLSKKYKRISGVIHAVNDKISPVAIGEPELIFGKDHLIENILDVEFKISPFSFFQTNSFQLDNFIGKIIEYAELNGNQTVWDLYCGTGSITIPAASKCKKIIGFEIVESSINDARMNADKNGLENVEFFSTDLHDKNIPELLQKLEKPDVLIVDPPRAGLHKNLIHHINNIKAPKLVYVSCNPATQARDLEILKENYNLIEVQPFDMFPQTYHIESIAKLELKND
jgi:23S rRNA (uracil1939-C5)-methyltransferase